MASLHQYVAGLRGVVTVLWLSGEALPATADTIAVPVPVVNIRAGDVITEELIGTRRVPVSERISSDVVLSRQQAVGKTARRPLRAGTAIAVGAIGEPYVIKEGQRVVIHVNIPGLDIRTYGIALQSGAVSEIINVRNPETNVVIRGTVTAAGGVEVDAR